ncbi:MAG TPA: type II CAAX endopeptidase family protein [Clostridia bacterium]
MEDPILNDGNDMSLQKDVILEDKFRKPSVLSVSALYSITVLIFVFSSKYVKNIIPSNYYYGALIGEIVLILAPAIIFVVAGKYEFRKVLRINKLDPLNLLLIPSIMIVSLPLIGFINLINYLFINFIFGKVTTNQLPPSPGLSGFILQLIVVAGSAALCEEAMFRGVILRGFEKAGTVTAILISSLLFGLLHLDFEKLLGTFILGALICFFTYRTNSIFAGMAAHFTNNAIAVCFIKLSEIIKNYTERNAKILHESSKNIPKLSTEINFNQIFSSVPANQKIIFIITASIMFLGILAFSGFLFWLLIRTFIRRTRVSVVPARNEKIPLLKPSLALLPALDVILFIFVAQGLSLKGIHIPLIETILKFLR